MQTAEQVVAALTGGVVSTAVNIPADQRGGHRGARPVRPARAAARPDRRARWPTASSASRSSTWAGSPSATPACSPSPCSSACSPAARRRRSTSSTRRRWPRSAGSRSPSAREPVARDYADLVRVTLVERRRARPRGRHDARAAAPPAPARGLGPALQPPDRRHAPDAVPLLRRARHGRPRRLLLRRARDQHLRPPRSAVRTAGARTDLAVMAVTTDVRVPDDVVDQIAASDGFVTGRSITLSWLGGGGSSSGTGAPGPAWRHRQPAPARGGGDTWRFMLRASAQAASTLRRSATGTLIEEADRSAGLPQAARIERQRGGGGGGAVRPTSDPTPLQHNGDDVQTHFDGLARRSWTAAATSSVTGATRCQGIIVLLQGHINQSLISSTLCGGGGARWHTRRRHALPWKAATDVERLCSTRGIHLTTAMNSSHHISLTCLREVTNMRTHSVDDLVTSPSPSHNAKMQHQPCLQGSPLILLVGTLFIHGS